MSKQRVFGKGSEKKGRIAVASTKAAGANIITTSSPLNLDISKFNIFWDLMDTLDVLGYVRSALSIIGRSAVGSWWTFSKHPEYGAEAREGHRRRLYRFYTQPIRKWDNIKDFQSIAYRIMIATMYLKYFGQAAFKIIRNEEGGAVGLEFLHGYVFPNVDSKGYFKSPAFVQYPNRNRTDRVEFNDPKDIVYITNPDWRGYAGGGSDIEALTSFSMPIDIYLQTTAREYLRNRDRPEAFFILPADISDDAFDAFSAAIQAKYTGPKNAGRSPITVAGELDIKELSKMPTDLPYAEARLETRKELMAATGVSEPKLGLTAGVTNSNFKEIRREFFETNMIPLFRQIEQALFEQIHVREFGIYGWEFKFNNPDFLTAVERATIHMRYYGINAINPTEVRREIGYGDRTDPLGNLYADQLAILREEEKRDQEAEGQDLPGSPPEGRPVEPDDPAQIGEPDMEEIPPERGDGHDDVGSENREMVSELRKWRSFAINRVKGGKPLRKFATAHVPDYLNDAIQLELGACINVDEIVAVFDEVFAVLNGEEE